MTGGDFPDQLRPAMRRAIRLEYWNLFWSGSIVVVMGLVMGQSQAMKTAWVEDMLGLVPPLAFLVAAHFELKRRRSHRFPFGFERANGLGFFVAAVALAAVGMQLLWDAVATLTAREHATIGSTMIFGHEIWLGWLMVAAQLYSLVPPLIIGRKELPLARALNDKLLHADALLRELARRFPEATIRLRETGRVIRAEIHGAAPPEPQVDPVEYWHGDPERSWRLAQVSFVPRRENATGIAAAASL